MVSNAGETVVRKMTAHPSKTFSLVGNECENILTPKYVRMICFRSSSHNTLNAHAAGSLPVPYSTIFDDVGLADRA
jgi:hypothetical protein